MQRLWVLLAALGLAACSGLPWNVVAPKVSVAEVEIRRLGLLEQHFDVGLRVSNPNDFDLTIEALEFELEVNGRPFANGLAQIPTRVPASSNALLRVDAFMQSEHLVRQFRTLTPDSLKDGVPYRIKGRIKLNPPSGWLPFDHSGLYGGDRK
jgi:LEA14-like dessication related protein